MNDEQELRDRLAAVDVPASRIEMDGLLRAGRRRTVRRRGVQAVGAALAVGTLLAVPSVVAGKRTNPATALHEATPVPSTAAAEVADAPRSCRAAKLPVPAGVKDVSASGVDPSGRYIVGNGFAGQDFRPVLWTDGRPRALPVLGESVELSAVNASGVVVGLVNDGREEYVVRYENGEYTKLRTPPGDWHPYPVPTINAAGDVLINVEPKGNSGGKDSIVLLWKAGSTSPVRLPLPEGANGHDITDDGTIIGSRYEDGVAVDAYAWNQRGEGRKLEKPKGMRAAGYAGQGDWATGGLWEDGTAALWNVRTGKLVRLDFPGPGDAVNAAGWVTVAGTLVRDGAAVELPAPKGESSRATGLSDTGLVVGHTVGAKDGDGKGPRTWQC